ncbi:MAG: ornithine carbamoyltransferase [Coriobacteriales bacterium]|nr:ornithine carbamoyltransferase [Coriobacteriales bacterium]
MPKLDILNLQSLGKDGILDVMHLAQKNKFDRCAFLETKCLKDKKVAIIMEKPSLRTRTSFECACVDLGAYPVLLCDKNSAFSRGESDYDTIKVLERFVDAVILRTYEQSKLKALSEYVSIPIINALSDDFHPCQGLADLLTIIEHKGDPYNLTMCYIGDASNNMCNTYVELACIMGIHLNIACPKNFGPSTKMLDFIKSSPNSSFVQIFDDPKLAIKDADVVFTDTWVSMGDEEKSTEIIKYFDGFCVDMELFNLAKTNAIFMHCLPAHRGLEVSDEVMDCERSVIFDEAENRLHAQTALLQLVFEKSLF